MTINRFQFTAVQQHPSATLGHHLPDADPRMVESDYDGSQVRDPFHVHAGYEKRIPMDADAYYIHGATGRQLSHSDYRRDTRLIDRAMDRKYYPDEFEDDDD